MTDVPNSNHEGQSAKFREPVKKQEVDSRNSGIDEGGRKRGSLSQPFVIQGIDAFVHIHRHDPFVKPLNMNELYTLI